MCVCRWRTMIVGTTKIISATSLIDTLIDNKDNFAPLDEEEGGE